MRHALVPMKTLIQGLALGTLIVGAVACSPESGGAPGASNEAAATATTDPNAGDAVPIPDFDSVTVDSLGSSSKEEDIQDGAALAQPAPTLFDAEALMVAFGRIFNAKDPAYAGSEWFSNADRKAFGSFNLLAKTPEERNVNKTTDLSIAYERALRAFLGRGCTALVAREAAQPKAANILVKAAAVPTVQAVDDFMRRLYGIGPRAEDGAFLEGAAAYQAVFAANMAKEAAGTTATARRAANYIYLCMAVGSDPRAYIR